MVAIAYHFKFNIMTDTEKLKAFAHEVSEMLRLQKEYFKTSKLGREGKEAPDTVRAALSASIKQEKRVSDLLKKVLNPQTTLL